MNKTENNPKELVQVSFPAPPSFSVKTFCDLVEQTGYVNHKYNYDLDRLKQYIPELNKRYLNDCVAKAILGHCFGEKLARDFRDWVRSQMDESLELPDGGASIGADEEGLQCV